MEKENFLGKLRKLVELAKSKQNALDVTEINNFFMGDNLQTEQMEQTSSPIDIAATNTADVTFFKLFFFIVFPP